MKNLGNITMIEEMDTAFYKSLSKEDEFIVSTLVDYMILNKQKSVNEDFIDYLKEIIILSSTINKKIPNTIINQMLLEVQEILSSNLGSILIIKAYERYDNAIYVENILTNIYSKIKILPNCKINIGDITNNDISVLENLLNIKTSNSIIDNINDILYTIKFLK